MPSGRQVKSLSRMQTSEVDMWGHRVHISPYHGVTPIYFLTRPHRCFPPAAINEAFPLPAFTTLESSRLPDSRQPGGYEIDCITVLICFSLVSDEMEYFFLNVLLLCVFSSVRRPYPFSCLFDSDCCITGVLYIFFTLILC